MMAFTHIAAGAASALMLLKGIGVGSGQQAMLCIAGGITGSLLPDIDHPKSWLGRRIPFVSIPLSSLIGHRGATHSMIALIVVQALVLVSILLWKGEHGVWLAPFLTGLGIGYASHLLADWMSNTGIPLLWPNRRRFAAPITVRTGSAIEYILALALLAWTTHEAIGRFAHA